MNEKYDRIKQDPRICRKTQALKAVYDYLDVDYFEFEDFEICKHIIKEILEEIGEFDGIQT